YGRGNQPPPPKPERLRVRGDNPRAARHDARSRVAQQVVKRRVAEPLFAACRQARIAPARRAFGPSWAVERDAAQLSELRLPSPTLQATEVHWCWGVGVSAAIAYHESDAY